MNSTGEDEFPYDPCEYQPQIFLVRLPSFTGQGDIIMAVVESFIVQLFHYAPASTKEEAGYFRNGR